MASFVQAVAARLIKLETAVATLEAWRSQILPAPPISIDRLEARQALHTLIHEHFDEDELKLLCFDIGVIYGDLGSGGHDDKIMELIMLLIRRKMIPTLLVRLEQLRPSVVWPNLE